MPSASQLYGGGFIKASDLTPMGKRRIAIINDATPQVVGQDQKQMLGLLLNSTFSGISDRILLLNKTNMLQLVTAFGDDYARWIGRSIEIWSENVSFQSRLVPGIKVMPAPRQSRPQPATPPVDMPPDAEPDSVLAIDDDEVPF